MATFRKTIVSKLFPITSDMLVEPLPMPATPELAKVKDAMRDKIMLGVYARSQVGSVQEYRDLEWTKRQEPDSLAR